MPPRAPLLALLALPLLSTAALAQRTLPDPSYTVINNTGQTLEMLFASPVGSHDWGHDRLGSEPVPSGTSRLVRLDPRDGCRYDLRAVFRDGTVQDMRNTNTCAARSYRLGPAAPPPEPRLELRNAGREPIVAAFVSPAGAGDWGMDQLDVHPLPPGRSFRLELPPGACRYDVKVLYADSASEERRGLDLCASPAVRFP
ncbi:hypothetical protein E0493_03345 [Roseomonas sp. M0104]|uniref:Tat pathway signal protein n=1 Tax=Teichococcus coralli TaxID=2545983 RepID=A0A845BAJ6_9PROT|nr:hypothetical protein [Pseudoroseomonas coralli]MXP62387.1 hypothetical protein [Pseudoroseomonas coralli]